MRLFIAVDLTDAVRQRIAAEQRRLERVAAGAVRWVRPGQLHVTLAFLGSIDARQAGAVVAAIERGFGQPPFSLAFGGLGALPSAHRPRVLYLGLTSGADQIVALQRLVARRLEDNGVELERRPFRPHLTLARWREADSADARDLLASAEQGSLAREDVDRVTLYESRLSPKGATHTPLAEGALTGPS